MATSQKIFRFEKNKFIENFRNAGNKAHARTFDLHPLPRDANNQKPLKTHHFFIPKHGFPCQNLVLLVRTYLAQPPCLSQGLASASQRLATSNERRKRGFMQPGAVETPLFARTSGGNQLLSGGKEVLCCRERWKHSYFQQGAVETNFRAHGNSRPRARFSDERYFFFAHW